MIDQTKEVEVTNRHPHADFLAEAVKDTSRKIEGKYLEHRDWEVCSLKHVAASGNDWQFRFVDTVKLVRVSPLTDEELNKVWFEGHDKYSDHDEQRRAIANAAHNRAIDDVIKIVEKSKSISSDLYVQMGFDECKTLLLKQLGE